MSTSVDLFPSPSYNPNAAVLPGANAESTKALHEVLVDNHETHHIFFNDQGFHNHASHHALALWALGAPAAIIKAAYKKDASYQNPSHASPEPITENNFNDHVGEREFYDAYLKFFTNVVQTKGMDYALEQYIFSRRANVAKDEGGEHPAMLSRFLDAIVHPMIHTGYGFEFDIPGMVIEGLAEAAVHKASSAVLIPHNSFNAESGVNDLTSKLKDTLSVSDPTAVHAFTTIARILKDDRISAKDAEEQAMFQQAVATNANLIHEYVQEWLPDPSFIEGKAEELHWALVLLYALPGWSVGGAKFRADFHLMHLVTSSLFLRPLQEHLSAHSQWLLLRSYFAVSLTWWVARNKTPLDIPGFFASKLPSLDMSAGPTPPEWYHLHKELPAPNPWLSIIQGTLGHPEDHVSKIQRAFAHYAQLYGSTTAGKEVFAETELEGADKVDGSLFLRAATLTHLRVTGDKDFEEGNEFPWWDFKGFF